MPTPFAVHPLPCRLPQLPLQPQPESTRSRPTCSSRPPWPTFPPPSTPSSSPPPPIDRTRMPIRTPTSAPRATWPTPFFAPAGSSNVGSLSRALESMVSPTVDGSGNQRPPISETAWPRPCSGPRNSPMPSPGRPASSAPPASTAPAATDSWTNASARNGRCRRRVSIPTVSIATTAQERCFTSCTYRWPTSRPQSSPPIGIPRNPARF